MPPAICCTSIGPNVRAGLIDAPVAGATGMMAAKTAMPMASAGEAAGGRLVDRAEDDEDEDERADGLGEEGLAGADSGAVGGDAEADVGLPCRRARR